MVQEPHLSRLATRLQHADGLPRRVLNAGAGDGLFSVWAQNPGERHDKSDLDCFLRCNFAGEQCADQGRHRE